MILNCDFETRSPVELKYSGVYRYAEHPDTSPWCLCYSFNDEEQIDVWVPGQPVPERIADELQNIEQLRAWNAGFERIIWWMILCRRYGWPRPEREQFVDTAAEAAAMSLPRKLEDAARVLNVDAQKDVEGYRLMMKMSKPRKPTKKNPEAGWHDAPDDIARLIEYCKQDVRTEKAVASKLRPLSDYERRVYLLDQQINDRGVAIDTELVRAAQIMVKVGVERANASMLALTDGEVASVTKVADLTRWLNHRNPDIDNVRKDTLRDLLGGETLDDLTREVVALRSASAKSSNAKLASMQDVVNGDDRARGLLLYHGAGTGRWAGRLIQPQNFPRGTVKNVHEFIPRVLANEYDLIDMEHPVLAVISTMLRNCFIASPNGRLMSGDYAQIEARVVAWIAEQEDLVTEFGREKHKVYEKMAAYIYKKPVESIGKDDLERQIGKVTILGAGFGMGWETFQTQTKVQTGIVLTDDEAQSAITGYRELNANVRSFWYAIERAAINAVREPGTTTSCGRGGKIKFTKRGQYLWCFLPSGRPLCYALPVINPRKTPWGDVKDGLSYAGVNPKTRQWSRHHAYGGLLTENVVQAMARDIMAAAMLRLEPKGYPIVLSVHDELVADVPNDRGSFDEYLSLMKVKPKWADGLPVQVEGWEGQRYKK